MTPCTMRWKITLDICSASDFADLCGDRGEASQSMLLRSKIKKCRDCVLTIEV